MSVYRAERPRSGDRTGDCDPPSASIPPVHAVSRRRFPRRADRWGSEGGVDPPTPQVFFRTIGSVQPRVAWWRGRSV